MSARVSPKQPAGRERSRLLVLGERLSFAPRHPPPPHTIDSASEVRKLVCLLERWAGGSGDTIRYSAF